MGWDSLLNILASERTNKAIDTLFKLSSILALGTGIFALWSWLVRPKLLIWLMKVGLWKYKDTGWEREVVTIDIKNQRNIKALGAKAIIYFLSRPDDAKILENERDLHWAASGDSKTTTGEFTIDIGMTPQRLDVFFTHKGQEVPGCWLGVSWSLYSIPVTDQYYMPPGRYEFELKVFCDNGKGQKKRYRFQSPSTGEKLAKPEEIKSSIKKLFETISFQRKRETDD